MDTKGKIALVEDVPLRLLAGDQLVGVAVWAQHLLAAAGCCPVAAVSVVADGSGPDPAVVGVVVVGSPSRSSFIILPQPFGR